jgi:alpha-glucan,water dikinase
MPDGGLQPEGSVVMHKAVETPFLNCDDDECDVEISGAKVPLQRITINLPPGGAEGEAGAGVEQG